MRTCDNVWFWARVLMLLPAIPLAAFAQRNESSRSLGQLLNPDGSLQLKKWVQGSFRADGYRMELGPHGEPRFHPPSSPLSSTTGVVADTADIHWDNRFVASTGFDGPVHAIFVDSGTAYFGGYFTAVGSTPAKSIVKWDGVTWSPLGAGIGGAVHAIARFRNDIYVGGEFSKAGGAPANNVARWDGNDWTTLGVYPFNSGYSGVRALLPVRDSLYIAGDFVWYDDDTTNGVAIWDGTSVTPMRGEKLQSYLNYSLASDGKYVYVGGGGFWIQGSGQAAMGLIRWDGSSWSLVGTPAHNGVHGEVYCMTWINGNLYVGGQFDSAGGVNANNVARWDGSQWTPLGAGFNGGVGALSFFGGRLYAGGGFSASGIDTMNAIGWYDTAGGTWNLVSTGVAPPRSGIGALAHMNNSLLMGGEFSDWNNSYGNGRGTSYYAASWNGGTLIPLGMQSPSDGISGEGSGSGINDWLWQQVNAIAVQGNKVYVGGNFTAVGPVRANNIACWNIVTKAWSPLGMGVDNSVIAIAVDGSDVYAGGLFSNAGGAPASRIARWDGMTWHPIGNPPNDGVSDVIFSLLPYSGNLYVGGYFSVAGGVSAANIARWNGSSWSALGSGLNLPVYGMAAFHDELYVGGWFTQAGGSSANYMARWDGVSWKTVGNSPDDGVNNIVSVLYATGDYLYAGGQFTKAGTTDANSIARWDGSSWSALGPGLNGDVCTITSWGGNVYAGGNFAASGIQTVNHIARWDTSSPTWTTLGSGTNSKVFALGTVGDDLFAGGRFTVAGAKASSWIGHWNSTSIASGVAQERPAPQLFALERNYPNPFNPSTSIRYEIGGRTENGVGSKETKLAVYDILGREVAVLVNERKGPGTYSVRFDGSGLASGVYFYRLTAGRYTECRKMLLMK